MPVKDQGAETKLKEAARKIFLEKGFDGTKTRDIAEAAGMNLALVNYYFRSKKKLYDIIMMETIQLMIGRITGVINDESTTLKEKMALFVERYIDTLTENPDIPLFILAETKRDPKSFLERLKVIDTIKQSVGARQFMEAAIKGEIPPIHPLHFMMNLSGLVVFPFIASPIISEGSGMSKEVISEIIQERKKLIPLWIEAMLKVKG